MTIRSASLLTAVALATLAAPALAQDDYRPGPPPPLPGYEEDAWEEEWDEEVIDASEPDYPYYDEYGDSEQQQPMPPQSPVRPLGYSAEQRDAWLAQCRANFSLAIYSRDYRSGWRGERRGEVIGGVIGAVAGGVAGNRIAGRGDRLGGTLIGAGVGGLAGAVIGGAVGRDSDREQVADYCEDYLVRYEQSNAYAQPGYGYAYTAVRVLVPVVAPQRDNTSCSCESVVAEVIEEAIEPAPLPAARQMRPAPDKRIRIVN